MRRRASRSTKQAEPARQCVPRQKPGNEGNEGNELVVESDFKPAEPIIAVLYWRKGTRDEDK